MQKRLVLFGIVMALLASGCSMKEYRLFQSENEPEITRITDTEYEGEMVFENKIQPNDRLSIKIYNQSGADGHQMTSMLTSRLEGRYASSEEMGMLVTKHGTVRLPLIGAVELSGLTEDEAAIKLIEAYKKYLRDPYVIVEMMNQRIFVLGEVNKPGVVPVINGAMNLIEAIARSGDLTDYAERTNIKIIRGDLRAPSVRVIDLTDMTTIVASNLYIRPNDIVYIQPRGMKGYNMAFKEIAPPFQLLSNILQPFVNIRYLSE